MKKIISAIVLGTILSFSCGFVLAEESTTTDNTLTLMLQQIAALQAQIQTLQNQIQQLQQTQSQLKIEIKETKQEMLQISKQLKIGMKGEDVTILQEFLATDPDIYPEGLITGYFGQLTEKAVRKFQAKMGVEQVGNVGPKTVSKINELLTEGAGNSGKVPPGLLISPGIAKKIGYQPQPLPGQVLPKGIAKKLETPTTTPEEPEEPETPADTTAPVISGLTSSSTTNVATNIIWTTDEVANGKVYYSLITPLEVSTTTSYEIAAGLTLEHNLLVSGLTASTTYYYLAISADLTGNTATSSEYSFTTLGE